MRFAICFVVVVTALAAFVGVKIVDMVETADQFRPNVQQILDSSK